MTSLDMLAVEHFPMSSIAAVNVACVPQRSPLRYPGGKTWLIPHIRAWLGRFGTPPELLFEPFAGGGIVSLTAVMEGLATRALMAELDHDVAAFWRAALGSAPPLKERVQQFEPTREAVNALAARTPRDDVEHGFRTLVLNRTRRGGILAPGAALSRAGENGRGVASRWYPQTLVRRLDEIEGHAARIGFRETDGVQLLASMAQQWKPGTVAFVDPPYTAGGKRAGRRLYAHNQIDHERLFALLAEHDMEFLMTYDYAPEIAALVKKHAFHTVQVIMKNTHHAKLAELVITKQPMFHEPPIDG